MLFQPWGNRTQDRPSLCDMGGVWSRRNPQSEWVPGGPWEEKGLSNRGRNQMGVVKAAKWKLAMTMVLPWAPAKLDLMAKCLKICSVKTAYWPSSRKKWLQGHNGVSIWAFVLMPRRICIYTVNFLLRRNATFDFFFVESWQKRGRRLMDLRIRGSVI